MTSIEWLVKELYTEMNMSGDGRVLDEILEEAKEMHKQEIIDAHDMGYIDGGNHKKVTAEMYFEETFVSKGSGVPKLGNEDVPKLGYDAQLPQQEISDEEIENAWEMFRIQNPNTVGGFQDQYASFLFAIKWYREQLKQRQ